MICSKIHRLDDGVLGCCRTTTWHVGIMLQRATLDEMSEQQGHALAMAARKKNTTPAPDAESAGRQAALDRALAQIEKTYGKGSIMRLEGMASPHLPESERAPRAWTWPWVVEGCPRAHR